jgi:hypothetical protein
MNTDETETGQQQLDSNMVNELRNHHVKKLLNHLGGKDVPPYLQRAIKRSFSEFAEDITNGDIKHDTQKESTGNR